MQKSRKSNRILHQIARKCEFSDSDLEIKRQLIQGTISARLRRKAIEQSLTLDQILKNARAMEAAEEQTIQIEKEQFESDVTSNEEKSHGTFYVAKGPSRSLLSWKSRKG